MLRTASHPHRLARRTAARTGRRHNRSTGRRIVAGLVLLLALLCGPLAHADPSVAASGAPRSIETAVVGVVEAEERSLRQRAEERFSAVRRELTPILANAPAVPEQMIDALRLAGGGSLDWFGGALATLAAALAAGVLAFRAANRATRSMGRPGGEGRAANIAAALLALVRGGLATAAFFVAGWLLALMLHPVKSPERVTAIAVVAATAAFLLARTVFRALLAPGDPAHRVLPFDDRLAGALHREVLAVVALSSAVTWICFWLAEFPLLDRAHQLMLMIAATLSAGLLAAVAVGHRTAIRAAIAPAGASGPRRLAGAVWLPAILLYLVLAWVVNIAGVALHQRLVMGPVLAPIVAAVVGLVVAGMVLVVHAARTEGPSHWDRLAQAVAAAAATIAGCATLAAAWGLFEGDTGMVTRQLLGLALVVLLAWIAWRAVAIAIEARLAEETRHGGDEHDVGGIGPGASRLATLLPIARNVLFFVIAAIALMVVLADLGVNVAPLFAGAGVVGLAVGFGAQSLIRDMFSGAFFLFDDAFRRGEYVEVAGVMGQVERISVRSFQLRHQSGALHTIPFGEIKHLTNYSRDWVIMKLPIRVTFDTDVALVTRLVKRLGKEMAADPELGPLFLDPPKSQGVAQMDDSAMIVRIKFKTKPGDQFLVRRHIYQRVHDLFSENGIRFANREVTVRVTGTDDPDVRRRAALAATEDAIDAATAADAHDLAAQ